MERTPLDNWTILICSKGTNISRFVSAKESITHVVRPLTMYIENLEEGPFALFTLCGLCIDPPRLQHQLHNEIVGHSQCCRFSLKKKTLKIFHCLSLQDKRMLPPACILSTYMTMYKHIGGGVKPHLRSNLLHHAEDFFYMHTFNLLNTNVN